MDNNNMMNNEGNVWTEQPQFDQTQNNQMQYDSNAGYNMGAQPYGDPYGQGMYQQPYQQGYQQPYQQPYQNNIYRQPGEGGGVDGKAVASLICGIVGILLCCCYGLPGVILGVVAIVLAVLSKKDNMDTFPGLAIGGLICGVIAIVAGVTFIGIMIYSVVVGSY